jgi:phosphate acyltransferase
MEYWEVFMQNILGTENPSVGLLNIGQEEIKRNNAIKTAHELMKDFPGLNFAGNIEGNASIQGIHD